jgi:hypothetical protein
MPRLPLLPLACLAAIGVAAWTLVWLLAGEPLLSAGEDVYATVTDLVAALLAGRLPF